VAHLVISPTALTFLTKISEKCQFASSSPIQVKNWRKTVIAEGKLDIIQLETGE
jgi:hypothetical protein